MNVRKRRLLSAANVAPSSSKRLNRRVLYEDLGRPLLKEGAEGRAVPRMRKKQWATRVSNDRSAFWGSAAVRRSPPRRWFVGARR